MSVELPLEIHAELSVVLDLLFDRGIGRPLGERCVHDNVVRAIGGAHPRHRGQNLDDLSLSRQAPALLVQLSEDLPLVQHGSLRTSKRTG